MSLSLDINRNEFSATIQTILKQAMPPLPRPPPPPPLTPERLQAVCQVLGSDTCAHEADLSIVSVSDDIPGMGEGDDSGSPCIAIS